MTELPERKAAPPGSVDRKAVVVPEDPRKWSIPRVLQHVSEQLQANPALRMTVDEALALFGCDSSGLTPDVLFSIAKSEDAKTQLADALERQDYGSAMACAGAAMGFLFLLGEPLQSRIAAEAEYFLRDIDLTKLNYMQRKVAEVVLQQSRDQTLGFSNGDKVIVGITKPTGTGKTTDECVIPFLIRCKGPALIVVPSKQLREQHVSSFRSGSNSCEYTKHGLLAPDECPAVLEMDEKNKVDALKKTKGKPVIVIANVQQLEARGSELKKLPSDFFGCIIFDEVHHLNATTYSAIALHFKDAIVFGLSATMFRSETNRIAAEPALEKTASGKRKTRSASARRAANTSATRVVVPDGLSFTIASAVENNLIRNVRLIELREEKGLQMRLGGGQLTRYTHGQVNGEPGSKSTFATNFAETDACILPICRAVGLALVNTRLLGKHAGHRAMIRAKTKVHAECIVRKFNAMFDGSSATKRPKLNAVSYYSKGGADGTEKKKGKSHRKSAGTKSEDVKAVAAKTKGGLDRDLKTFKDQPATKMTIDVLVIVQALSEGFNCPEVSVIGICAPVLSRLVFNQLIGRSSRVYPAEREQKERNEASWNSIVITHAGLNNRPLWDSYLAQEAPTKAKPKKKAPLKSLASSSQPGDDGRLVLWATDALSPARAAAAPPVDELLKHPLFHSDAKGADIAKEVGQTALQALTYLRRPMAKSNCVLRALKNMAADQLGVANFVFDRKTIQDFGTESWLQDVCRAVEQQLTDRKADSDERVWRTELKDADEDSEDIAKMFANVIRVAVKVLAVKASQEQVAATLARSIVLCRGKPSTYEHIHGTLEYFTEHHPAEPVGPVVLGILLPALKAAKFGSQQRGRLADSLAESLHNTNLSDVALDPLIFDLLKLTDEELERDAVASLSEEFYWAPLSGLGHAFASLRPSKNKEARNLASHLIRKMLARPGHSDEVLALAFGLIKHRCRGFAVSHDRWKRLILPAFGVVTKVAAETLKSFHFANVVGAVLDIHTAQPVERKLEIMARASEMLVQHKIGSKDSLVAWMGELWLNPRPKGQRDKNVATVHSDIIDLVEVYFNSAWTGVESKDPRVTALSTDMFKVLQAIANSPALQSSSYLAISFANIIARLSWNGTVWAPKTDIRPRLEEAISIDCAVSLLKLFHESRSAEVDRGAHNLVRYLARMCQDSAKTAAAVADLAVFDYVLLLVRKFPLVGHFAKLLKNLLTHNMGFAVDRPQVFELLAASLANDAKADLSPTCEAVDMLAHLYAPERKLRFLLPAKAKRDALKGCQRSLLKWKERDGVTDETPKETKFFDAALAKGEQLIGDLNKTFGKDAAGKDALTSVNDELEAEDDAEDEDEDDEDDTNKQPDILRPEDDDEPDDVVEGGHETKAAPAAAGFVSSMSLDAPSESQRHGKRKLDKDGGSAEQGAAKRARFDSGSAGSAGAAGSGSAGPAGSAGGAGSSADPDGDASMT